MLAFAASLLGITVSPPGICLNGAMAPAGQPCPIVGPFVVYFDWSRADITTQGARVLEVALGSIRDNGVTRIELIGHADASGPAEANLSLSRHRAESVRRYLIGRGIAPASIEVEARGETMPLIETPDGVAQQQNRYVVIRFGPG